MKALNLLRVVAHKDWGADCAFWLKLYLSHVHLKLKYGCVMYGSARQSVLESLDRVQNAALRTCLGAFNSSPVSSLQWKQMNCPFNYDVTNRVSNISLNFDLIHATQHSVTWVELASASILMLIDRKLRLR